MQGDRVAVLDDERGRVARGVPGVQWGRAAVVHVRLLAAALRDHSRYALASAH